MHALLPSSTSDGSINFGSRNAEDVSITSEGPFDQALIDRIVFGRWWIPHTYHVTITAVVILFALRYWSGRLWERLRRDLSERNHARRRESTLSERAPLLESLELKGRPQKHALLRTLRLRIRATLTYQPPPLPLFNRPMPSNATTLLILFLLAINLTYLTYYTIASLPIFTACLLDRAGLLFVANLPWLYLLAAKNQPLRLLTSYSYEGLNILHRRLGEWMCLLAMLHVAGFFGFWWFYARPGPGEDAVAVLKGWLLQGFVLVGIGAFAAYEVLWATSLARFRRWWYEGFLAGHVVLQGAGLVLVFLHHPNARVDVGVALAVFVVDRVVYRAAVKLRAMSARVEIMEDGETMLLSVDWPLTERTAWWRRIFGKDVLSGWKPLEHVFVTAPTLGRAHRLQAHPFTIASAAPEGDQQHSWLSLIVRARDGFTRDLLHHAQVSSTVPIRFDGPYGSQHAVDMVRSSDTAILVAGGSGIAVAYPVIWSVLHAIKTDARRIRCKHVALIWIVRETSHISWIGMERLDELRELGLHLVLPKPTSQTGRPDVRTLLEEAVEETSSGQAGERIGVVASAPDAMNRDVNNACVSMAWEGRDVRVMVEKFGW